uniref:Uncharacterized protein n=1 Tax=Anas platyrhynchos platyrhynchos TaxID=8840 RepID=A0A493TAT7_ANAPP
MVWCGAVQSFLFDRKVGLVNRGVQLAILAYVIGPSWSQEQRLCFVCGLLQSENI